MMDREYNTKADWAFIAAAGMGTRMQPLTDHCPKPLIELNGQSLLDHCVDRLIEVGIHHIAVNAHYKGEMIEEWAVQRSQKNRNIVIDVLYEEDLLDTGGGIENAVHMLEKETPFFMINGDAFWLDGAVRTLTSLNQDWCKSASDIMLLLEPVEAMKVTQAVGDYEWNGSDEAILPMRSKERAGNYMFTGVRIIHPRIFEPRNGTIPKYSFLENMDAAEKRGKLGASHHQGQWFHLSTPDDVRAVEDMLSKQCKEAG